MNDISTKALVMWTVYDHPTDMPKWYVARRWLVDGSGPRPTASVLKAVTISSLRYKLREMGLTRLERHETDDSAILETWL